MRNITLLVLICYLAFTLGCGGGGSSSEATPADNNPNETERLDPRAQTIESILAEPPKGGSGGAARCGGELGFRRCICPNDVPSYVRYRPAVVECNGNAAAILSGRLFDAFSIVVRDTQNRDRWPEAGSGFGGCSFEEANGDSPPARCSAFKAQDIFVAAPGVRVYCFGASGYSEIFSDAARLTVKLTDSPFSNEDEVERYCLSGPDISLN